MAITPRAVRGARRFLPWWVLLAVGVKSLPVFAAELPVRPETHVLSNGLRLVMVPFSSPGLVAVYSVVRVGSRDEVRRGRSGFAHFFEHMMFRGTEAWPKERVRTLLMEAGADQNGFTTDDFTCYTFVGSADFLEPWLEREADRFRRLTYTKADFRAEARAVFGEYRQNRSEVYLPLMEHLRRAVFARHPYRHPTIGTLADVRRMPGRYGYALKFFRRHYTPDNTTVIVVGEFERAALVRMVEEHFGGWVGRKARVRVRRDRRQRREIRSKLALPIRTSPHLSLSWRTPRTNFDRPATAVYNVLFELLFGEASVLYRTLVLERAVVANFREWSWNHRDPYFFHVVATLHDAAQLRAVERAIYAEVRRLRKRGPGVAELENVKAHVRYRTLMELDTPDRIARRLAFTVGASGRVDGLPRGLDAIERLTAEDVRRFVRRFLTRRNRAVVTVLSTGGAS